MRKARTTPVKARRAFAILVDGECEVWYLQMLKRHERSLQVNIEPRIPQKKSVSDQYATVVELSKEYTKVFWVVDLDVMVSQSRSTKKGDKTPLQFFREYYDVINMNDKVVIIVNNPCIEFWLLLHFESTSKYFDTCANAEKQLKKHMQDYEKTKKYYTKDDNDIYLKLRPRLQTAIQNAKKLGKFNIAETQVAMAEFQKFFEADELSGHFKEQVKKES